MLRTTLAALAALAFTAAAQAADPPPSPEEIAKERAVADRIIQKNGVGDLFDNATDGAVPTIRHKASGLTCGFDDEKSASVHVYPNAVRGDDVSCGSYVVDFTVTLYATRAPAGMTLDQATAVVGQAIHTAYPDAKPYRGQAATMTEQGGPETHTGRFILHLNGKEVWSFVAVSVVKGWIVEERVTGPLDKAMEGDILAGTFMIAAVHDVNGDPLGKK
jgi:hypothetical protein